MARELSTWRSRQTSILKSLKLTNAKPARASNDPVERARNKVISARVEQKAMAEAKVVGQHFAPTHLTQGKAGQSEVGHCREEPGRPWSGPSRSMRRPAAMPHLLSVVSLSATGLSWLVTKLEPSLT